VILFLCSNETFLKDLNHKITFSSQISFCSVQTLSCDLRLQAISCRLSRPHAQGRPLGGASVALAPAAEFEGAPKRRSPTGHTLIRSTVAWWFPHLQTKKVAKNLKKNLIVLALAYCEVFWCLHMYIHDILCLLLQILFVAALDIKTRNVPTVSWINSLSQYCKASHFFANFYVWGEGGAKKAVTDRPHINT
jgi:hypothetical protein